MSDIIVRIRPENAIPHPSFSALIVGMIIEIRDLNTLINEFVTSYNYPI